MTDNESADKGLIEKGAKALANSRWETHLQWDSAAENLRGLYRQMAETFLGAVADDIRAQERERIAVAIEDETEVDPNPESSNDPLNSMWNAAIRVAATLARQEPTT